MYDKPEPRTWPPVGGYPYDDLEELNKPKKIKHLIFNPTSNAPFPYLVEEKINEIIDSINRINNAG